MCIIVAKSLMSQKKLLFSFVRQKSTLVLRDVISESFEYITESKDRCSESEVKMTIESSFCQMLHDPKTLITN